MTDSRMNTYNRLPIDLVEGKGAMVRDANGKEYLDALSGIAVCSLGHSPDEITRAICDQAGKLIHCTNIYELSIQRKLGDRLIGLSGMDNVFFGNSGAEANEAAIKIARKFGNDRKIKNPTIIVTEGAFHGRTLATLTATGSRKIQAGFEPLVQGFARARYGDIEAIKMIASTTSEIVAVMVEPIQGEAGVVIPPDDYLNQIRDLCDQNNWLMILDEIQTGMCRTGKWFAHQHNGILPDIMTLAKSLGNGMPIGACLARGKAAEVFQPGNHGSTFGGNPLACRTAMAVIEKMENDNLADRATALGKRIVEGFHNALTDVDGIVEIRGLGLMIGIELEKPCGELVKTAADNGLLINVTGDNRVRLLPPLVLTDEEADRIVSVLAPLIKSFLND